MYFMLPTSVKDTLNSLQLLTLALWALFGLLVYPRSTCTRLHLPDVLNYHDLGELNAQVSTRILQKDFASKSSC